MGVLGSLTETWRLFWVLEAVGLSFMLALLSIKVTGVHSLVDTEDRYAAVCGWPDCSIYTWWFIVWLHPATVTICALATTSAVSAPRSSLAGRWLLATCSPGWVALKCLFLCCWAFMGWYLSFELEDYAYPYVHSVLAVFVTLLAFSCRRELKAQFIDSHRRFYATVDPHPRKYLLCGGLAVGVVVLVMTIGVILCISNGTNEWFINIYADWIFFLFGVVDLSIDVWLIFGLLSKGGCPQVDGLPVQQVTWMLLGWWAYYLSNSIFYWVFAEASASESVIALLLLPGSYFAALACKLAIGTLLWGERAGAYGVAFWATASVMRTSVILCVTNWVMTWAVGVVK